MDLCTVTHFRSMKVLSTFSVAFESFDFGRSNS